MLRIEDTDSQRFVPGAEDYINEALAWLGITIDEGVREGGPYGPYKQSERRDIYREYVGKLLDAGRAYIAFDTPRGSRPPVPPPPISGTTPRPADACATPSPSAPRRLSASSITARNMWCDSFVEPGRDVTVDDMVRGLVTINSSILDDKVLYKSADDLPHIPSGQHCRRPSHEDHPCDTRRGWLPSAPLHVLLYEAFGWTDTMPRFVHLPLLLKPDGKASSPSATATASDSPYSHSNGTTPRAATYPRDTVRRAIYPKLWSISSHSSAGTPATTPK